MRKISGLFGAVPRIAALTGLMLAAAIAAPAHDSSVARANPGKARASAAGLSSLPVAAQGTISARLGRDLPAYRIRSVSGGFEGQNPKKTLRSDFTSEGVTVHGAGAAWSMALRGYGYGDDLNAVQETAPRASANRVEYRHGPMTEWYVNGPLGLEQGFTLNKRPCKQFPSLVEEGAVEFPSSVEKGLVEFPSSVEEGVRGWCPSEKTALDTTPASGVGAWCRSEKTLIDTTPASGHPSSPEEGNSSGRPLTLAMSVSGNVAASVSDTGKGLVLATNGHAVLRYTGLLAYDADGKQLRAWLEVQGDRLLLRADDAGARYPVTIDPFVQLAELTASDGTANDYLGSSVAVSGNTVVVGADQNYSGGTGVAYVFVKPTSGWQNMTQTAELTASDGLPRDEFGWSVSASGNTVVVGAPNVTVAGNINQGAAYVFVEPVGGWVDMTETAKLTASDGAYENYFGSAVATNGSTIIAGASGWNLAEGKAYVFVEPAGGWRTTSAFTAILTPSHGEAGDEFGWSVAISGNTVAVGSPATNGHNGTVRIFVRPATGWVDMTETARLSGSDESVSEPLGASVAISGNTVVAGAPSHAGRRGGGAVYVFVEPASGWKTGTQTAELTASDAADSDLLGASVSISGNAVVAGALQEGTGGPGKAYVFVEPTGGWRNMTQTAELTASDGAAGAFFGYSVGVSGNNVVVGAPQAAINGNQYQGSAYVFGP